MTTWLPVMYLAVSSVTLTWQAMSLGRLLRSGGAIVPGLRRTLACRVAVAVVYVVLGVVTLVTGSLPLASLVIFGGVQIVWWANSALDLGVQRRSSPPGPRAMPPESPPGQLPGAASVPPMGSGEVVVIPVTPQSGITTSEGVVTAVTVVFGGVLDLATAAGWVAPLDPAVRGAVIVSITAVVGGVVAFYQRQRTALKIAHVQAVAANPVVAALVPPV